MDRMSLYEEATKGMIHGYQVGSPRSIPSPNSDTHAYVLLFRAFVGRASYSAGARIMTVQRSPSSKARILAARHSSSDSSRVLWTMPALRTSRKSGRLPADLWHHFLPRPIGRHSVPHAVFAPTARILVDIRSWLAQDLILISQAGCLALGEAYRAAGPVPLLRPR
jgi:hypothetical protein